jgi:hypothetical protein
MLSPPEWYSAHNSAGHTRRELCNSTGGKRSGRIIKPKNPPNWQIVIETIASNKYDTGNFNSRNERYCAEKSDKGRIYFLNDEAPNLDSGVGNIISL